MSANLATTALRPFVPGGKDFALSKRFYQALGFRIIFEADQVAGLACDSGQFLLQDHYAKDWAENFMMQLVVADLDAWWAHIETLDLAGGFGVQPPRAPVMQPWGLRVAYVFGPCGELWHIAQA
ncbi:VOC family protein [Sphingomonas sp. dw_22]|uniref:VOC family protein n=1 Tax=Sphingomonas sp. dw_22 TaxID=2721175 RepID=UPI001BD3B6FD|nr:VOC family protein [Sphingomonas sp. dw_22]